MIAWLLTFAYLSTVVAIPGIQSQSECQRLAQTLQAQYGFGNYRCQPYTSNTH